VKRHKQGCPNIENMLAEVVGFLLPFFKISEIECEMRIWILLMKMAGMMVFFFCLNKHLHTVLYTGSFY